MAITENDIKFEVYEKPCNDIELWGYNKTTKKEELITELGEHSYDTVYEQGMLVNRLNDLLEDDYDLLKSIKNDYFIEDDLQLNNYSKFSVKVVLYCHKYKNPKCLFKKYVKI